MAEDCPDCRRRQDELTRLRAEVAEARVQRQEFLALLAHELRNPLAPLGCVGEVLRRRGNHDPIVRWAAEVVGRQVRALRRLVDGWIDTAHVAYGAVDLDCKSLDVDDWIDRATSLIEPTLASRQQSVRRSLLDRPLVVHGDPERLAQALAHLLHNAAKFSAPRSSIFVIARRVEGEVSVCVCDRGRGIAPERLPRLFEPKSHADTSGDPGILGFGLGLTLTRTLVELHGGRVEARSAGEGRGAEFEIRLPAPHNGHVLN
jgi:signal transduction histidine kinase